MLTWKTVPCGWGGKMTKTAILRVTLLTAVVAVRPAAGQPNPAGRRTAVEPTRSNLQVEHDDASFSTKISIRAAEGRVAWSDVLGGLARARGFDAAALQGISIPFTRMLAFAIGCGLAGAAGALMAPLMHIHPYIGLTPLLKAFIIIVLGGLGSIPGALLGGVIVGCVDGMAATFIGSPAATLIGFAMFLTILVVRPKGLIGRA